MASNPPSVCCTSGFQHEGTPNGRKIKVAGVDAYESGQISSSKAVLYIPDVIGIWQNAKLIADQLAAKGYYVLLLDILNGDPVPLNRSLDYDLFAWREHGNDGKTPHTLEAVEPLVKEAIDYLRTQRGFRRIGAIGYCFGAKFLVRSMSKQGIDVGYIAHPSFVEEKELQNIQGPLSISAAEIDTVFTSELRHKSETILGKTGFPWQINLFSGVKHGFAVRGDMDDPKQRHAKEQAFSQAVSWLGTYL